jgi:hypothetical protein
MATPQVHIELDPGPWTEAEYADYRVLGEPISGKVRIAADEPITCRSVTVSIGWHTEGRGDRDEGTVWESQVHEGEIPAGEMELPFRAELPDGPMSYAGQYINILWEVAAQIDLAWKRDPTAERRFHAVLP